MKFTSVSVATIAALVATGCKAFIPTTMQRPLFAVVTSRHTSTSTKAPWTWMSSTADAELTKESYQFTSVVGRVMDLIINSLYSDKDIFLRELISNAADACDKRRFLSLTGDDAKPVSPSIQIKADPDNNTIIIQDSGVGMTKDELINNLGRIAQSGTRAFVEALGEGTADVNLIGQFGVGFYSAYLVADKVEVMTKSMQEGSKQYRWISDAKNAYTVEEDVNGEPFESGAGTRLILHLKDDALEYLESAKIEELLQRYSEFIEFPISVWKETTEYKQVPHEAGEEEILFVTQHQCQLVPRSIQFHLISPTLRLLDL